VVGLSEWSFSPDGRSIVALTTPFEGPAIMVVPSDGKGQPAFFDVGATLEDGPPQWRPDGAEIMFMGRESRAIKRGVYALDPSSGSVRTIIPAPTDTTDIHSASWSPDGKRIAYGVHDEAAQVISTRTHVISADGSGDITVDTHPDSVADAGTTWSNDGTRLIISRFLDEEGTQARSVVVPVDRSGPGIEIECPPGIQPRLDCTAAWTWSPDDSVLLAPPFEADPVTGTIRPAPWTSTTEADWQRRAR
jgi:Tol biopolymer transport system component